MKIYTDTLKKKGRYIAFPVISAGPQISAAHLGINVEISASPQISTAPINAALIRIVTILY